MAAPGSLSPETAQRAVAVARTLVSAARNAALYSPDHPAARAATTRFGNAVGTATGGDFITIGIAAEAAAYLHARDLLRITFSRVDDDTLYALLQLLTEDVEAVRARGGIAAAWTATGRAGIEIEAIDYHSMLSEPEKQVDRKDD